MRKRDDSDKVNRDTSKKGKKAKIKERRHKCAKEREA